jgi:aldose 1-epimerase
MRPVSEKEKEMAVTKKAFGTSKEGKELTLYTIDNGSVQVDLTDLGATIVSVRMQDKNETVRDIVLGYDSPEGYYENSCFFGAVIGRSGNRIDKGRFSIGGKEYQLDINDNENNLHSGLNGFDKRQWETERISDDSVTFSLKDADMEQGYPGNFQVCVTYTLTAENSLILHYEGECDADTVANMTNHVYFNLGGHDSGSIEDHEMLLRCGYYTPVRDSQAIPTGEIAPVEGTPMDFRQAKPIGQDIEADFEQLKFVQGYDHNFVIKREKGVVEQFAQVYCPKTGICMTASTDLPGVQFYAGNCITPGQTGKGGVVYGKRHGFCLESQYYPNSINQEGFASPLLKAGEKYDTKTVYTFSVR